MQPKESAKGLGAKGNHLGIRSRQCDGRLRGGDRARQAPAVEDVYNKGFWFNYLWRILSTDGRRFSSNLICEGEPHGFETT